MMNRIRMLGVALFFLAWTVICPLSRAYAFFSEDGFASFWGEGVRQGEAGAGRPAAPQGAQVAAATGELAHRLAAGETLWSLARYYHVDLARLMSVNRIADPTRLSVGLVLLIPGRTAAQEGAQQSSAQQPAAQQPAAVHAAARGWDNNLAWPLLGELTQQFGPQAGGQFHHGLDIAGSTGTPVRAAQRGIVASCGWMPIYGFTVIIDHGSGYKTLYAHLHDFMAKAGAMVDKGQVIAHAGSTGNADGPHLHFELRKNDQAINPLPYLSN